MNQDKYTILSSLIGFPEKFPTLYPLTGLNNLEESESFHKIYPPEVTSPRRVYIRPERMLLACSDLNKFINLRPLCRKSIDKLFNIHKNVDLPRCTSSIDEIDNDIINIRDRKVDVWGDNFTFAPHKFNPSYISHGLITYILSYAALTGYEEDRVFCEEVGNWLYWQSKYVVKGYRKAPNLDFYQRLFFQFTWILIAFSESPILSLRLRTLLKKEAIENIRWVNSLKAVTGDVDKIGYDSKLRLLYLNHDYSKQTGNRTFHVYFHQLLNEMFLRIEHTNFYKSVPEVREFRNKIEETNKTLFQVFKSSVSEFRGTRLFIDSGKTESYPISYAPQPLWLSVKNKIQLLDLLKGLNIKYTPYFYYDPSYILINYRIQEKDNINKEDKNIKIDKNISNKELKKAIAHLNEAMRILKNETKK